MTTDHFAHKADSYDKDKDKVDNVAQIATAMRGVIQFRRSMHIIDFGAGTGLLLEFIAPYVGKITAIDVSQSMNAQLSEKLGRLGCSVEILEMDLETTSLEGKFDGIISSMTMHHIKDVPTMFGKFRTLLNDGGFIAIADLDSEGGDFHGKADGVHHAGFDRDAFIQAASSAGFKNLAISTASVINKSQRAYPVFLLTGVR